MTEEIEFYSSPADRRTRIAAIEAAGKTVIHDDFVNALGQATNGRSGRLTFDTLAAPTLTPRQIRLRQLRVKFINDTVTADEVKEFVKLTLVDRQ